MVAAAAAPAVLGAQAAPTRVMIRVTAHDAKIIGSGVGGARVTVRDAGTGEILAEGVQEGSTGNTRGIMVTPRTRGATVFDTEGAAGYLASLQLDQPTVVEISVEGPLGDPQGARRASKTVLVVPGHDIVGEGVVIEVLGHTVRLLAPTADQGLIAGVPFTVEASVTMLCGCPTEPGGLWNADDIVVQARVVAEGREVARRNLRFAGTRNMFAGELVISEPGEYQLEVLAMNDATGNHGMATRSLEIGESR